MQPILRDNCRGLCQEEYCSSKHTQFCNATINKMRLHIALCDKHSEQFENAGWQSFIEGTDERGRL